MFNGQIGVLIAKAMKNPNHKYLPIFQSILGRDREMRRKSVLPKLFLIHKIETNINKEPNKVYKNSKNPALYFLELEPQIIINKNKGIKTLSKKM